MRIPVLMLAVPAILVAQDKPVITFNKTHHDFGKIPGDKKVTYRFKVSNTGKAFLNITQLNPSCGCTSSNAGKWSLAAGESTEIEIGFDPKTFRGAVRKSLQVVSDDPANPVSTLTFEAEVIHEITPSTTALFFLDVQRSQGRKGSLRLISGNGQPVVVTEVRSPGAPYLAATWKAEGKDVAIDVTLDAKKIPTSRLHGLDNLVIQTNNPRFGSIPIQVQWALQANITATPDRVAWSEAPGAALSKPVTLSHVQNRPFRITGVRTTQDALVSVSGVGAAAAVSHKVQVNFKGQKEGFYNEKVIFSTDDPEQPELELRVSVVLQPK